MNNDKLWEIELLRKLRPPIDNIDLFDSINNLPENSRFPMAMFALGEISAKYNHLSLSSIETAQVLQIDGLANFLRNNIHFIEGFELYSIEGGQEIRYKGSSINEDLFDLSITPLEVLSTRLSENFNYRYSFTYKFLLTALKKALRIKMITSLEEIEYVERVVNLLITDGKFKRQLPFSKICKEVGMDKKTVAHILDKLGWQRKTYKSGNVVYTKPD